MPKTQVRRGSPKPHLRTQKIKLQGRSAFPSNKAAFGPNDPALGDPNAGPLSGTSAGPIGPPLPGTAGPGETDG